VIVGSGVDVIEIARIERTLARVGQRFARRVFTPAEAEVCLGHARPALHFALRFAAKEAGMKAVGTGWARGVRWRDFEALWVKGLAESDAEAAARQQAGGAADGVAQRGPHGSWRMALHGRAAAIAAERGGARVHLSIGHSRTHALAVVLLESGPSGPSRPSGQGGSLGQSGPIGDGGPRGLHGPVGPVGSTGPGTQRHPGGSGRPA